MQQQASWFIITLLLLIVVFQFTLRFSEYPSLVAVSRTQKHPASSWSRHSIHQDGWVDIHIFIGNNSTSDLQLNNRTFFSQVRQDEIILDLLSDDATKSSRFFVDLAANDPVQLSNTLALELQANWDGLCIEPNKEYWYGLTHRKCTVVGAVVGGTSPQKVKVRFRSEFGGIVNHLNPDEERTRQQEQPLPMEERYTVPIRDVLTRFHVPKTIDYMNLDVEGAEYFVMENFPFDEYRVLLMTVERPTDELRALLEKHDYIFLKKLVFWGETLWAHKSSGFTPSHPKVVKLKTKQPNGKWE